MNTGNTEKIHRTQLLQAAELLTAILSGTLPADQQMENYFRQHRKMGARDRRFVAETVYGCLRRRRLLETLSNNMQADARALVVAYLAACDGWSARALTAKDFIPDAESLVQHIRAIDRGALPFAVRASLPDWIAERLLAQYGAHEADELAEALNRPASLDIRVNTHKAARADVAARLAQEGYSVAPTPYSPDGLRASSRRPLFQCAGFRAGEFEVQDEGSQLISLLMEPKRREHVMDFCAGAGGKTLHLAALMQNTGAVYAVDVSARRLQNLKPRLLRAGLDNVRAMTIESEDDPELDGWHERMDRVLVDAPCSGTGTLRRNPDIKWRAIDLLSLTASQSNILRAAARLVKPGGRLVYATCSLLREENEEVAERFLAEHPGFATIPAGDILARLGITIEHAVTEQGFLRLLPHRHGTDGFFAAVFTRRDHGE